MIDQALAEHAEAKELIARIQKSDARYSELDLRGLVRPYAKIERATNVKAYNRPLSRLIERDKARPSWIVSHELPLKKAPEAYVLKPGS